MVQRLNKRVKIENICFDLKSIFVCQYTSIKKENIVLHIIITKRHIKGNEL